jgi:hypothetical protein
MTVVSTLDVHGLTAQEYRAVMDELEVETRPEGGIYLHLTTPIELGFRGVEIWDEKQGFDRFVEQRLAQAGEAVGLQREMTIAVSPLHNVFAPRLTELPTHRGVASGSAKRECRFESLSNCENNESRLVIEAVGG